jgi:hypothetical protein
LLEPRKALFEEEWREMEKPILTIDTPGAAADSPPGITH